VQAWCLPKGENQMTTFAEAKKSHLVIRKCFNEDQLACRALWAATVGVGEPEFDSFAEAVQDTAPTQYASLLAQGDTANAYALSCVWSHRTRALSSDAFGRRELAREAWEQFGRRAEQAADIERGLGCDDSLAWETMRDTKIKQDELRLVQRIAKLAGRMYAQDEAGRGPLVIALDESGSMDGGYGVSRREWSKAAAVALTRVAHDDNRAVSIIHFSTSITRRELQPGDSRGILDMIRHWFDGGTRIPRALRAAAEEVERLQKQGDRGADVVIVTDARTHENSQSYIDAAIDAIESYGSRLWTVAVECHVDEEHPLRARAEHYIQIAGSEMNDADVSSLQGTVI
jgi:Mg-chelatase subunit ChlD